MKMAGSSYLTLLLMQWLLSWLNHLDSEPVYQMLMSFKVPSSSVLRVNITVIPCTGFFQPNGFCLRTSHIFLWTSTMASLWWWTRSVSIAGDTRRRVETQLEHAEPCVESQRHGTFMLFTMAAVSTPGHRQIDWFCESVSCILWSQKEDLHTALGLMNNGCFLWPRDSRVSEGPGPLTVQAALLIGVPPRPFV